MEASLHGAPTLLLTDSASGARVSVALVSGNAATAEGSGGFIVYRGAAPGKGHVIVRPGADGAEDYLTFKEAPPESEVAYDVALEQGIVGLRLVSNVLEFLDDKGTPRIHVTPPILHDAACNVVPATLTLEGCAADHDPRGPWGRPLTAPGASTCRVHVRWDSNKVTYPAVLDPAWASAGTVPYGAVFESTATALADGKTVLVAGGATSSNEQNGTASAALYNGATGTWASTGVMVSPRWWHTATLLQDGRVLVTGGRTLNGVVTGSSIVVTTDTTEIWNPSTGTFTNAAPMANSQQGHSATLLADGRVLVAGGTNTPGFSSGGSTSSAAYNPSTDAWTSTGAMNARRAVFSMTATANGKILAAGGYDANTAAYLATSELFDPTSNTWTATSGQLATARWAHAAAAFPDGSGKVLVAAGGNSADVQTAEIWNPSTSTWSSGGSLAAARFFPKSVIVGKRILVVGGSQNGTPLGTTELFDPAQPVGSAWSSAGAMASARYVPAVSIAESNPIAIQGWDGTQLLSSAEAISGLCNCDDGNACNGVETCGVSGCVAGTPINTDDGNACTTDSCNTSTGAVTHVPVSTDDGNSCTTDSCNTNTGAVSHTPVSPGTSCSDGNACNGDEVCDPSGTCKTHVNAPSAIPNARQGTPCGGAPAACMLQRSCDGAGACGTATAAPDGTSCETDNDVCDGISVCKTGACTAGTPITTKYSPAGCTYGTNCCAQTACLPAVGLVTSSISGAPAWCTATVSGAGSGDPTTSADANYAGSTSFLYTGSNPVQTGVAAGTIDSSRVAVVVGQILGGDGITPLTGVTAQIVNHPEYGQTHAGVDGRFAMAVNGGGTYTVDLQLAGYLRSQRTVATTWHDYAVVPNVVMFQQTGSTASVAPSGAGGSWVVAPSGTTTWASSDGDGSRQPHLFFPPGVAAVTSMGAVATPFTLRATEHTVGTLGKAAMPGTLPSQTGYTYAAGFSIDGTGTNRVSFVDASCTPLTTSCASKPILMYLDNFIGFPVGATVPNGSYDATNGAWVPEPNGIVLRILDSAGHIDVTGDNGEDASDQAILAALVPPITTTSTERAALWNTYQGAKTLWRVPLAHFSDWDSNWGIVPPADAHPPKTPPTASGNGPDDPCLRNGSIIECENSTLQERIPVFGTPYALAYHSDHQPGRLAIFDVPLTGTIDSTNPLDDVSRIDVEVTVAGRQYTYSATKGTAWISGQRVHFEWDRTDAFGRTVSGPITATVRVGNVYAGQYGQTSKFGYKGNGVAITGNRALRELELWKTEQILLTPRVAQASMGFGGWEIDAVHVLDHAHDRFASALMSTVAGGGSNTVPATGTIPGTTASTTYASALAAAADGSIFIADNGRVYKLTTDGNLSAYAGGGSGFTEGASASSVSVNAGGMAVAPDGTIYYSEGNYIRKITPDKHVATVAGTGVTDASTCQLTLTNGACAAPVTPGNSLCPRTCTDGLSARQVDLVDPAQVAVAPDGTIYWTERLVVRHLLADGTIYTVAGNGWSGVTASLLDGRDPTTGNLSYPGLAFAPDGTLLIGDEGHHVIWYVDPTGGALRLLGGNINYQPPSGSETNQGNGGTVAAAKFSSPQFIAWSAGTILVADTGSSFWNVRSIAPSGLINAVTNPNGNNRYTNVTNTPAVATVIAGAKGMALAPDGSLYISQNGRVERIRPAGPGVAAQQPSRDGSEVYQFDVDGRHIATVDGWRGKTLTSFSYDTSGLLQTITDGSGNATTITRPTNAVSIAGPYGQTTTITLDASTHAATKIMTPAGEAYTMSLGSDGAHTNGLLNWLQDPTGDASHQHVFHYDAAGLLVSDQDPLGNTQTLSRTPTPNGWLTTITSGAGRVTKHDFEVFDDNVVQRTVTGPSGAIATSTRGDDLTTTTSLPNGDILTSVVTSDARYGLDAPLVGSESWKTPSGLVRSIARTQALSGGTGGFTATSEVDTTSVNGKTWTSTSDFSNASQTTITTQSPVGRQSTTTLDLQMRTTGIAALGKGPAPTAPAPLASVAFVYETGTGTHGRLTTVTQASGSTQRQYQFGYGADGFVSTVTDPLNRVVTFNTRDADGRVKQETLPGTLQVNTQYDGNGNVTSVTPPGESAHVFNWNFGIDLASYQPPAVSGVSPKDTSYGYDADKLLTQLGVPVTPATWTRDGAGRATGYSYAVGTTTYSGYTTYNTAGQVMTVGTADGVTLAFTYDGHLPLTTTLTATGTSGTFTRTFTRTYDSLFRVASDMLDTSTPPTQVSYAYDDDGLLASATVAGTGGAVFNVNRCALPPCTNASSASTNGLIYSTTLSNIKETPIYNAFGELVSDTVTYTGSPSSTLYSVVYDRDAGGRVHHKTETIGANAAVVTRYEYDAAGRLYQVYACNTGCTVASLDARTTADRTFTYTANGNRTDAVIGSGCSANPSACYDAQDRLALPGYAYTNNGELSQKPLAGGNASYTYDLLGNLRRAVLPSPTTTVDYVIDGQNHRVGKKVGGVVVQGFVYDGNRIVAELDGTGAVVSRFVYGTRANVPEFVLHGTGTYRLITDQLGSVRLMVDATTGGVVQEIDYDEWGNVTYATPNPSFTQPFGFAGGLADVAMGFIRFGARDYDPSVGRWTSKDPDRFAGGSNLYAYANNDPVNFVGETGKGPRLLLPYCFAGAVGGALGGATALAPAGGVGAVPGAEVGALLGCLGGALIALSVPDPPAMCMSYRDRPWTGDIQECRDFGVAGRTVCCFRVCAKFGSNKQCIDDCVSQSK